MGLYRLKSGSHLQGALRVDKRTGEILDQPRHYRWSDPNNNVVESDQNLALEDPHKWEVYAGSAPPQATRNVPGSANYEPKPPPPPGPAEFAEAAMASGRLSVVQARERAKQLREMAEQLEETADQAEAAEQEPGGIPQKQLDEVRKHRALVIGEDAARREQEVMEKALKEYQEAEKARQAAQAKQAKGRKQANGPFVRDEPEEETPRPQSARKTTAQQARPATTTEEEEVAEEEDGDGLDGLTVAQLQDVAQKRGVQFNRSMRKDELLQAIRQGQEESGSEEQEGDEAE